MRHNRYYIHLSVLVLGLIFLAGSVAANEELDPPQILIEVDYDINSLTIIIAQEEVFSLRSFSLTGYGERQIRLSDYAALETYDFDRISGPVCIQFVRIGVNHAWPNICGKATRTGILLTIRDIFWLDDLGQLIAIKLDYEDNQSVFCSISVSAGSCRAIFEQPPPPPTPTPGADLIVTDEQLGSYFISPDLVTELEFDLFRQSDAYSLPDGIRPTQSMPIPLDAPYQGATWEEANVYCVWHSGYDRLPTVAEWQTALRLFPEQFEHSPDLVEWTDTKTSSNSGRDWYSVVGIDTADVFYPSDTISRFGFGFRCVKRLED